MNNKKEFLATEPIGKLLLKLSIPTVAAETVTDITKSFIKKFLLGEIYEHI